MERATGDSPGPDEHGYRVVDLIVDVRRQRVTRDGREIPLPQLSFDLLLALARAAPRIVSVDELMEQVWPGLVVSPETVSQRVKLVRDALGDDSHAPRYIAGVRGRGYRMAAPVEPLTAPEAPRIAAVTAEPAAAAATGAVAGPVPAARSPVGRRLVPLLALAVALSLAIAALVYFVSGGPRAPSGEEVAVARPSQSIAVLPLADLSPDGANQYLGDGLAAELCSRLARIPGLRVAAQTSSFAFRGRQTDVRTIGQSLGVDHVLEGSVRREGDRLRVTAQLVDAKSGYHVWAQTYDRTWQDLLAIEDDLARSIVGALRLVLSQSAARELAQPPTGSLEAFDLYLAGLARLREPTSARQLEDTRNLFGEAIAADPRFARAWAGLCEAFVLEYERNRDPAAAAQAEEACGRARALDRSLHEVDTALANLYLMSGRSERAVEIFRGAIRGNPGNADFHVGLARAFEAQGRPTEAESTYRRAVAVEPNYWGAHSALGRFLFSRGRAAEAVVHYRRVTELAPASALAFNNLGAALEMTGDFPEAARAFERSLELEPTRSAYSNTGTVYYYMGRFEDAARMFAQATTLAGADHRLWGNLADALAQIEGRSGEAAAHYRTAIRLAERGLAVNPQDAVSRAQLAYYQARTGDAARARRSLSRALELDPDAVYVQYYAALVALETGDPAAALAALERAVALGYPRELVRVAPELAALRGEPRFARLRAPNGGPPAR